MFSAKKVGSGLAVAAAMALYAGNASATVIATWTFETSIPTTAGPLSPEVGLGSGTALHANGATAYTNPAGNISAESWSANAWAVGDYYQYQVDSTGYQDIIVTWDQTGSSTGPRDFKVQYSTDGSSFTDFSTYTVLVNGAPNPSWGTATGGSVYSYTADLSAISALDNDSSIFVRFVDNSTSAINGTGTVATAGTGRQDNVSINGTAIPEPASLALLGLGGLFMFRRNRRNA